MLIDQTINDRATLLLQKMNDENIRAALDEIVLATGRSSVRESPCWGSRWVRCA